MGIYRVQVGQRSRKGTWLQGMERVVSFDGTHDELFQLMVKHYNGFTVMVQEVQEVEKIEKQTVSRRSSASYDFSHEVIINYLDVEKLVSSEKFKEWLDAEKKTAKLEGEIYNEAEAALTKRVEVSSAKLYELNGKYCKARVKLRGELYLAKEGK